MGEQKMQVEEKFPGLALLGGEGAEHKTTHRNQKITYIHIFKSKKQKPAWLSEVQTWRQIMLKNNTEAYCGD